MITCRTPFRLSFFGGGTDYPAWYSRSGGISVDPVAVSRDRFAELNDHLMLFFTGIRRTASSMAGRYVGDLETKNRELRIMQGLVDEGVAILRGREDIRKFGELFREAWAAKRSLGHDVSNSHVDEIHERGSQIIYHSEEEDFRRLESEREGRSIAAFRELDDMGPAPGPEPPTGAVRK